LILRRLLPLVAVGLLGCAGVGGSREEDPFARGFWPLYSADARPWAGVRESRALGPFLHWEERPDEARFEWRPLYSTLAASDLRRFDVLYPIWAKRLTPEREQSWLIALARTRQDAGTLASEATFGLAFRGRTADGARYSGVFPFYGTFRERLGFDRLSFALWPLFARARRGEYRETQLLWPFFALGRGGGRFKLHIWPLFGLERRDGVSEHRYALWPIFHWRRDHLDTGRPSRAFYALPFYGRRDRGPRHSRFYLFPLLARQWHDGDPDFRKLDVLWPIFSRARDSDSSLLALRPLYVGRRSESERSRSWLLGLVGRSETAAGDLLERRWRLLWVGQIGTRVEGDTETRRADLWPLFRRVSSRDANGSEQGFLRVPWLLPLKGLDPDGWHRHYNGLLELYSARWLGAERRSSTLFGLRETRTSPTASWTQWGGLLSYRSD
jgi:hypothetical protein